MKFHNLQQKFQNIRKFTTELQWRSLDKFSGYQVQYLKGKVHINFCFINVSDFQPWAGPSLWWRISFVRLQQVPTSFKKISITKITLRNYINYFASILRKFNEKNARASQKSKELQETMGTSYKSKELQRRSANLRKD